MIRLGLILLSLGTLLVASRVLLPVETVEVVGNRHLQVEQVQALTGLQVGTPWLWAWPSRLNPLRANPWVISAQLERPRVGRLRIVLKERVAVASVGLKDSRVGLSPDGVLLPGAEPRTPFLEAVPDGDYTELLALARAFPDALRIHADASGYRIIGPNLNLWSSSVKELQDWAKGRRIGRSEAATLQPQDPAVPAYPGPMVSVSRLNLYSWGVSTNR
ncbi:MAG: FtsQ-type POTRA domain-containing protein [Thermaceae bacterium]|nr:FtsQ-type POTRA domain-containing protein [Thermaceae bacterium]